MSPEHFDVVVVGAGLSGIGAAVRLQMGCPGKRYVIFEARAASGGTWDLFRYPGVRSDSDMFTLGYPFRPWSGDRAIAEGPDILRYLRDTAREHQVDRHIRYQHRVLDAEWSSADARWTLRVALAGTGEAVQVTCSFLFACAGYYRYDQGYLPRFPGVERFRGTVVHPQHWPADLDYAGKRVVVIGSGATAVTLVPAMARDARHVTMLQRSPSYILSLPARDRLAARLARVLPARLAYRAVRAKNVLLSVASYSLARRRPELAKRLLRAGLRRQLPPGFDIDTHFNPAYNPWDQRLCLVPNGDLFRAIRAGDASVVTDQIETFTESGLQLRSGRELPADVVVTATGLNLLPIGGLALRVDGAAVELPNTVSYKGMMLAGVPNFAFVLGYTNASWTLKADLVARYVCRLVNHMDATGLRQATPLPPPAGEPTLPLLDFSAGYVQRSIALLPRQGACAPWRLHQNYLRDLQLFRAPVADRAMRFSNPVGTPARDRHLSPAGG